MGLIIANCKGSVHVFGGGERSANGNLSLGRGFYDIFPRIPESSGSLALILGIPLDFQEIFQPSTTLDDKRVLHLFGTAWNELSLAGMLLLGDYTTRGEQLSELISWYNENRVSQRLKPIAVSLGTAGIDAYVVGLSLSQANPVNNTQMFSVRLVTADVQT